MWVEQDDTLSEPMLEALKGKLKPCFLQIILRFCHLAGLPDLMLQYLQRVGTACTLAGIFKCKRSCKLMQVGMGK